MNTLIAVLCFGLALLLAGIAGLMREDGKQNDPNNPDRGQYLLMIVSAAVMILIILTASWFPRGGTWYGSP